MGTYSAPNMSTSILEILETMNKHLRHDYLTMTGIILVRLHLSAPQRNSWRILAALIVWSVAPGEQQKKKRGEGGRQKQNIKIFLSSYIFLFDMFSFFDVE
jgi:hypothetical protein